MNRFIDGTHCRAWNPAETRAREEPYASSYGARLVAENIPYKLVSYIAFKVDEGPRSPAKLGAIITPFSLVGLLTMIMAALSIS